MNIPYNNAMYTTRKSDSKMWLTSALGTVAVLSNHSVRLSSSDRNALQKIYSSIFSLGSSFFSTCRGSNNAQKTMKPHRCEQGEMHVVYICHSVNGANSNFDPSHTKARLLCGPIKLLTLDRLRLLIYVL